MPQTGWTVDWTTYLVCPDAGYAYLPIKFFPAGECDVHEDNPIASHRKLEAALVLSRPYFFCFAECRAHPRVRHICFQRDVRSQDRFPAHILQSERNGSGTNLNWARANLEVNRDRGR
jgi:hypothetical protein